MNNDKTTPPTSRGRCSPLPNAMAAGALATIAFLHAGCEQTRHVHGHHHHHHHHVATPGPVRVVVGAADGTTTSEELTTSAKVGGFVEIELPANGGTGYTWSMTAHSEDVELIGAPESRPVEVNLPGGPTLTTFRLKMNAAGRQTARLELAQPWEADAPAARTVNLVISVAPGTSDAG